MTAEPDIEKTKAALRLQAVARRTALGADYRSEAAGRAAAHFITSVALTAGETVAAYWPMRDEMDCKPLLLMLSEREQPICLPAVVRRGSPLVMRLWDKDAPLYPNGFGTLAPADNAPVVEPDIVIVPLLAFDRYGTRLGYGGGYYDRTFAAGNKPVRRIGYAFGAQEMALLPRGPYDIPIEAVVTEDGMRYLANAGEVA